LLRSITHIAAIYGLEKADGLTALVLELVDGETLADRIAHGPNPLDEALPIARQIAEALETAHEHGIIHRDLKPANVKVREDGTVKVLDFGLAKALESTDGNDRRASLANSPTITSPAMMTGVGMILGTAAYMSPEQAKGKPTGKRSDIWALGCVLYEMLTGQRAFGGEDVTETLAAVVRSEPDWNALPTGTPPAIRRLLKRCLVKKDRDRVSDVSTVLFVLDESASFGTALASADDAPPVRAWWRLAVPGVALIVGAAMFGPIWTATHRPTPAAVTRTMIGTTSATALVSSGANSRSLTISPDPVWCMGAIVVW